MELKQGTTIKKGVITMDCENCWYYDYDEEYDAYYCMQEIDEDLWAKLTQNPNARCPYFKKGDEYTVAHMQ